MVLLFIVVHFVLIGGILSFLFVWHRYGYWKRKGVCCIVPTFPFGCFKGVGKSLHFSDALKMAYDELKIRCTYGGFYLFMTPMGLVNHLDLIRNILVRDFDYFTEKDEPLSAVEGEESKSIKNKLLSTFTTDSMQFAYPAVVNIAQKFRQTVQDSIKSSPELDVFELSERYTTDVIATCAFGVECNSLKDPNTEFRVQVKRVFNEKSNNENVVPNFSHFGGIKALPPKLQEFFMSTIKSLVEYREKKNIRRNGFIDLLVELKNDAKELTLEEVAVQAFQFLLDGYETSSTAMSFILYELAMHQDIQDKLRHEVMSTLAKYDGNLSYGAITEMIFMEQVVNETLRIHPPVPYLVRKTIKDYPVPGSWRIIERGITLFFPVLAIHLDEDIYPNPDVFDANRFSPEKVKNMHPCAFLPFGDGPRRCLGQGFGKMQIFLGLIALLREFKFSRCKKTEIPVKLNLSSSLLIPSDGIILKIEKL